ncbi:hypothetical protein AHZ32_11950 [Salmonella enterica]|uniref:hypothetical protein n=1 Tax=Salmonella enterica TaxID=28901 RepID=UPI0009AD6F97|nr:hypothetical protein [Salmonella enterica]EDT7010503.1 hypothetical protein [Salmonella enterica subsp. enterica serovar Abaetetuba]EAO9207741.1 hypothetical protein [Salmonella enterica]EAZ9222085.1 hypothetical protein [Salmonella enterica]EBK9620944.1 hypothetical protein [Salmonella enterica]EDW1889846.1 hypothetical protein [Salmonella enterica subsp. enterica serovar Abaetetuba]
MLGLWGKEMSFFDIIDHERRDIVPLKTFILELAAQEQHTPQEICALLAREYRKEFPEYEPFDFYYHDLVNSFVTVGKRHCINLLERCASVEQFDDVELFCPIENKATGMVEMREIIIKAREMAMFLMDISAGMPDCVKHVRKEVMDAYCRKNAVQYTQPPETEISTDSGHEWLKFRGRDTALTLISGLAMALCKGHANCTINGRPNHSAIANVATNSLIDAGFLSEMVGDRQLRSLLASALKHADFQNGGK